MEIAKLIGLSCVVVLADGRRLATLPSGPCWERGRPAGPPEMVKPMLPCGSPTHSAANKRWCACEAEKKAELARDSAEFDAKGLDVWNSRLPDGTVVNTFEQGAKERNAALARRQEEKNIEWQAKKDTVAELANLAWESVKAKFAGAFNKMVAKEKQAEKAVGKAIFMLLSVPSLTKKQFLLAKKALNDKYAALQEQGPIVKEMLLNLIANGHLGGPGVGRARVTEERRAYLATLRTLPSIDPGPQFKIEAYVPPPQREQSNCAGYARLCGADNGGIGCCPQSGKCTRNGAWEGNVSRTVPLHVCM